MSHIQKSTPRRPAKFPPPIAARKHNVKSGDNWWTLASHYGRSDPWDIIEFNFRTRDPREVNWYLEFYVGCTKPSADGANFSFDTSDSPGVIYIPPASWTPSEDLALRHVVAGALSGPVVARVNVTYKAKVITGTTLAVIANRVIDGEIGVVVDPKLSAHEAEYDSGTDTFHLGFRTAPSKTKKGLIVHEAVHAALDLKAATMTIAESESMGYVVQCFYVREYTLDPTTERLEDPNPRKDEVYRLGWDMAETLSKGAQPSAIEWLAMDHAVRRHPKYRRTAGRAAIFDGI